VLLSRVTLEEEKKKKKKKKEAKVINVKSIYRAYKN